jgi:hypothetical protein
MKRMLVLLLAAIVALPALAQNDEPPQQERRYQDDRDRDWGEEREVYVGDRGNRRDYDRNFSNRRELDIQIARINRTYDYKINAVRNDYFMNRYRKERLIRALEDQRRDEIRRVYQRFQYGDGNRNGGGRHRRNC